MGSPVDRLGGYRGYLAETDFWLKNCPGSLGLRPALLCLVDGRCPDARFGCTPATSAGPMTAEVAEGVAGFNH
ncbi:MAG: hypothetical protein EA381_15000, partial [Planctomycetaceae bacterium]